MNITESIQIDNDIQVVWHCLTEPDKIKKWNPCFIHETPLVEGALPGVGFKSIITLEENGKRNDYQSAVLEFEEGRKLSIALEGGNLGASPMIITQALTQKSGGVELEQNIKWRPSGFILSLLSPLISLVSKKKVSKDLLEIKKVAESVEHSQI